MKVYGLKNMNFVQLLHYSLHLGTWVALESVSCCCCRCHGLTDGKNHTRACQQRHSLGTLGHVRRPLLANPCTRLSFTRPLQPPDQGQGGQLMIRSASQRPLLKTAQEVMAFEAGAGAEPRAVKAQRIVVLVTAIGVALASGSNYVYSGYAPQLATQLGLSSTQVNLIGAAGNLGVYSSSPLWGKMVDAKGPRIPLVIASACLLAGYLGVQSFYVGRLGSTDASGHLSASGLIILGVCQFLTGLGGSAGLTGAMNAIAKSFTDKTRATATAIVLAGFGLSAFWFSFLSHALYPGDTAKFLVLLGVGCAVPMAIGAIVVQPVRPHSSAIKAGYESLAIEAGSGSDEEDIDSIPILRTSIDNATHSRVSSIELSRSRPRVTEPIPLRTSQHSRSHSLSPDVIDIYGGALWSTTDFWILAAALTCLSGVGLMYINNAGTVALALARRGSVDYDVKEVAKWQATQVAIVSLWNCAGRILMGALSDLAKAKYGIRRIWFMLVVSALFVLSQIAAIYQEDVEGLWKVSSLLGLAYGSLFGLAPMVVLEWFGLAHFAQNWGYASLSPVIGGNLLNLVFGRVYDSHTIGKIGSGVPPSIATRGGGVILDSSDHTHDCIIGAACYTSAFELSTFTSIVAFALSTWAAVRRENQGAERRRRGSELDDGDDEL